MTAQVYGYLLITVTCRILPSFRVGMGFAKSILFIQHLLYPDKFLGMAYYTG